jgi:hypothetical protein
MFSKKLLPNVQIIEGIIIFLFLFNACSDSTAPDKYVARVNDSFLTEAELSELADTVAFSKEHIKQIISNWVHNELLYQQAENNGIIKGREYTKIVENSSKKLAGALLLKKVSSEYTINVVPEEFEKYFMENKSNFVLQSTHFLLNRIKFNDYIKAVQFRSEMISNGWETALMKFKNDTSLIKSWTNTLFSEFEIYPRQILRVLEGLYPLEISIVISDEPGYYAVIEVLNRFEKGSIPPYRAIKPLVEKRFTAELEKLAIESYIKELYAKSEIEINYQNYED